MKLKLNCGLVIALWLGASLAWADSLELKNGSLIKGKFMGGTESEISFQVGSSVQKYNAVTECNIMLPLAAFPMRYYPASLCNPILPFNSKRSRLPNPAVRGGMATPVGATSGKVRFAVTREQRKC